MGIRQSFGLFLTPVTHHLAITAADFTLAIAIQNIVWGLSQAFVGAIADRFGLRITMIAGALIYIAGLCVMAAAQGVSALIISGGMIGVAVSCTATSLAMTACARAVSEQRRSMMLGLISAAGSLGTLFVPVATQALLSHKPWQIGMFFFVLLAIAMLPAAFLAGGADKLPGHSTGSLSLREVLGQAVRNRRFLVMSGAYFVCGLNLMFLTVHLPAYLALCGQDPMLSAGALAVIGGVSAVGSLLTGWLGGIYPKHILLGLLYSALADVRCLFCSTAHTGKHAPVRCSDGPALVARSGAAHRRPCRRDFWYPLYGDAARTILCRAPVGIVTWHLGRWADLRPFRLLRPRLADRRADWI
jgi:MFS family permease